MRWAWLIPGGIPLAARTFARRSAIGALLLGMAGQIIYHLLAAAHATRAPWPVVVLVSCMPVVTLGSAWTRSRNRRMPDPCVQRGPTGVPPRPVPRPGRRHSVRAEAADSRGRGKQVLPRPARGVVSIMHGCGFQLSGRIATA
jgi:hypothetical protein